MRKITKESIERAKRYYGMPADFTPAADGQAMRLATLLDQVKADRLEACAAYVAESTAVAGDPLREDQMARLADEMREFFQ